MQQNIQINNLRVLSGKRLSQFYHSQDQQNLTSSQIRSRSISFLPAFSYLTLFVSKFQCVCVHVILKCNVMAGFRQIKFDKKDDCGSIHLYNFFLKWSSIGVYSLLLLEDVANWLRRSFLECSKFGISNSLLAENSRPLVEGTQWNCLKNEHY